MAGSSVTVMGRSYNDLYRWYFLDGLSGRQEFLGIFCLASYMSDRFSQDKIYGITLFLAGSHVS